MKGYRALKKTAFILLMVITISASAAGGGPLMHMEVDLSDQTSLQRGAKIFVNYCLSCHSAAYMRYNRMGKDLGISEDVLKSNFMFGTDKVGSTMNIAMKKEDAEKFFGVAPPDLSVIARSRGADWLYSYFKTFYVDESRPFGVNNLQFPDVGMPNVLWQLQGTRRLTHTDHDDNAHHAPTYDELETISSGTQTEEEFDRTVRDLVNYLVYLGEPIKLKRTKIGFWVLVYLFVFMIITYLLKKEYWRDVH
jgi:ubiquinol-cytochrome c reductase cytochrome c1 subunit